MGDFNGKIAIITGGSGGIGSAVCLKLAQLGAKVVVHYGGSENAAEEIVSKIKENGGNAIALQADLSKGAEVTELFEQTEQQLGKPDILVTTSAFPCVFRRRGVARQFCRYWRCW